MKRDTSGCSRIRPRQHRPLRRRAPATRVPPPAPPAAASPQTATTPSTRLPPRRHVRGHRRTLTEVDVLVVGGGGGGGSRNGGGGGGGACCTREHDSCLIPSLVTRRRWRATRFEMAGGTSVPMDAWWQSSDEEDGGQVGLSSVDMAGQAALANPGGKAGLRWRRRWRWQVVGVLQDGNEAVTAAVASSLTYGLHVLRRRRWWLWKLGQIPVDDWWLGWRCGQDQSR